MEEITFTPGSVPVVVVARVYGKDASWVRAGIISGWLPIGKATRNGKLITNIEEMNSRYGRINFLHLSETALGGNGIFVERRPAMKSQP